MITIFYRPPYIGNYHRHMKYLHTLRLSSRIRAEEIAEYLGAQLIDIRKHPNKTASGVCIHVKPTGFNRIKPGHFFDYLDGGEFAKYLKDRPDIIVISASIHSFEVLKKSLQNKVTCIPSHHLNIERIRRKRKKILRCGYIGSSSGHAAKVYGQIADALKKIDMDFITCFDFKSREDAVAFYKKIDVFVIGDWELGDPNPHKIPTKIINAASFGIPTVAYPLACYKELEGFYVPAHNMKELVAGVQKLRDPKYYNDLSDKLITMSEAYHIENIAKLYRKLK